MNVWKGIAITLICFLLIILSFNLFIKPNVSETSSNQDEILKAYSAYMEKQNQINIEYYKKADATIEKAMKINELTLSNQEKFEKILARWEKQADRMDNLISRLEKKK